MAASTGCSDKQYAEIVEFYEARISRDIVPFIKTEVLNGNKGFKSFLDVGPGGGALTKQLAPTFDCVDVIEPNQGHSESLKPFNVSHDFIQDATMAEEQYDLILCCHVFYEIPRQLWETVSIRAGQTQNKLVAPLTQSIGLNQKYFPVLI